MAANCKILDWDDSRRKEGLVISTRQPLFDESKTPTHISAWVVVFQDCWLGQVVLIV